VDQSIKDALLDRLRAYLDGLDDSEPGKGPGAIDETGEATDLFAVFVEIAATRNEARAQSRLVKDALEQFRTVFDTLQSSHAALEQELKDARARSREQIRAALRPLLLDIIDVRDRLVAGLASPEPMRLKTWYEGWSELWLRTQPQSDPWREGLSMTLRRLDQLLADRRVTPIVTVGRPFTPAMARVVATIDDSSVTDGLVVAEARTGFTWEEELLRPAEVTVAMRTPSAQPIEEMQHD
jgi:molecular chaperone GrpE